MRGVILKMHTSLDGYARAATGDVVGWIFRSYDDELKTWEVDTLWRAGVHMGRKVYQEVAEYWPTSTEAFAPPMNEIPKIVFSKTQALAGRGLIDEFRLIVHPVVLSGGLALFTETMDPRLVNSRAFPAGAVALTYR